MWAYSLDEEYFSVAGETIGSAIIAATSELQDRLDEYRKAKGNPDAMFPVGPECTVYVGECTEPKPKFSDYCDILETLEEQAVDDEFGDAAGDWFSGIPKEWVQELNTAVDNIISEWLTKHDLEPKFMKVDSWTEVVITLK